MPKTDADCIFCKIVAGDIPCAKVYEDERVLAFLDIHPISRGHTLVIPKDHYEDLRTTPESVLCEVAAVLPTIAQAAVAGTGAEGFNVLQSNRRCAGQEVPHIHFHVVPRRSRDGIGLGFRHSPDIHDDLAQTAEAIRKAL